MVSDRRVEPHTPGGDPAVQPMIWSPAKTFHDAFDPLARTVITDMCSRCTPSGSATVSSSLNSITMPALASPLLSLSLGHKHWMWALTGSVG